MTDEEFQRLLVTIGALTPAQIVRLGAVVRGRLGGEPLVLQGVTAPVGNAATPTDCCASIADIEARFEL